MQKESLTPPPSYNTKGMVSPFEAKSYTAEHRQPLSHISCKHEITHTSEPRATTVPPKPGGGTKDSQAGRNLPMPQGKHAPNPRI